MDFVNLYRRFKKLGAPDPAGWAKSQVDEGIPQLARYIFLREAWAGVVADGDTGWIDEQMATPPDGPGGAIVGALQRLRATGADLKDISRVARTMQSPLLFHLCYLIDDPQTEDEDIGWSLCQIDSEGRLIANIDGLHESVLETDPTGREMKPDANRPD